MRGRRARRLWVAAIVLLVAGVALYIVMLAVALKAGGF
jgi:cytochrome c-type biogenesis protein CcmE